MWEGVCFELEQCFSFHLHGHGAKRPPESVGGSGAGLGFYISYLYFVVIVQCWREGTAGQQAQNDQGQ